MNRKIETPEGTILTEKTAANVKGIIISTTAPERYLFRVYTETGGFDDYKLRFSDLPITIDKDSLVSFYQNEDGEQYLDEKPETLGWKVIESES